MHQLPLKMTVVAARASTTRVEFDCVVEDANGVNVQSVPLTMGPDTSAAEASAILQSHVNNIAHGLLKRKTATLGVETATEEDKVKAIESMVGTTFSGSAVAS